MMTSRCCAAVLCALVMVACTASEDAAEEAGSASETLQAGTWGGSVAGAEGADLPVTYDVESHEGAVSITLDGGEFGAFEFLDIAMAGGTLRFNFGLELRRNCALLQQPDRSYVGDCTDVHGETSRLTMTPPAASN